MSMNAFTRACAPLLVLCVTAATAEAQGATQQSSTMVFPAGTVIDATFAGTVCTNTNKAGDRVSATVIDSTAHPPFRGATVGLVVIGLKESRNASQAPVVELAARTIHIRERAFPITVDSIWTRVRVVRYDRPAASASVGGCLDAGSAIRMTLEENLTIPR